MQQRPTREQWIGIIEDWQESGQSQREFCTKKDIVYSAFRYWFCTIKSEPIIGEAKIPVKAIEIARIGVPSFPMAPNETERREITTRGITVQIFGCDAAVTIVGRVRLDRLGQIIIACEGNANHAQA